MKIRPCLLLLAIVSALAVSANTLVQIRTPAGEIDLELFDQDKPATVQNFIRLIDSGAYANSFFHRLDTNFVLQGGGYFVYSNSFYAVPSFGFVTNEFSVGPRLSNTFGTVAMAKSPGNPDSASCQFFINMGNNAANLDNQNGGFTVFARVIRDGGLLSFLNSLSYGTGIVNIGGPFTALPVSYIGVRPPALSELLYTDLTLMRVAVTNTAAGMQVSWNSPFGSTNLVEYTDGFTPPSWVELLATNGTGLRMSVTDTNAVPGRFYRVRIR